jgi:hypothetical protein
MMRALYDTAEAQCIMDSVALFYLQSFIPRSDQHPIHIKQTVRACKVILHTGTVTNISWNLLAATNAQQECTKFTVNK